MVKYWIPGSSPRELMSIIIIITNISAPSRKVPEHGNANGTVFQHILDAPNYKMHANIRRTRLYDALSLAIWRTRQNTA